MFSENDKISKRQLFRLLFIDFLGGSSLLIPTYLAGVAGTWGILCILTGSAMGLLYTIGVIKLYEKSRTERFYGKTVARLCFLVGIISLGLFLYLVHILSSLMNTYLEDIPYWVFFGCTIILSIYTLTGNLECRAREYEILFWIILVPLVIMMLLAIRDVKPIYLLPQNVFQPTGFFVGTGFVFLFYLPMGYLIFEGRFINCGIKEWKKTVLHSLIFSALFLIGTYVILLGCFGRGSLIHMKYPIVTLMSTVNIEGLFFQRLDALMLFVWFFSLFSMLGLTLRFSVQFLKKTKALFGIALLVVCLSGCANTELEKKEFPMLMAVEEEKDGMIAFNYAFAKANFPAFGTGSNFSAARESFEETVAGRIDVNHLKVFVMGTRLLNDKEQMADMLETLSREESYPRNAYICASNDIESLMDVSLDNELGNYLVTYMDEHVEHIVTLGDLLNSYQNGKTGIQIPDMEVEHKIIVFETYYDFSWESE